MEPEQPTSLEICTAMLQIIFSIEHDEDQKATARATLVELSAPEYMEAMLDQVYELDDEVEFHGECSDPDCECHDDGIYGLDDDDDKFYGVDQPSLN